jgi:predicted MPP superfamily phosphohydrolase
MFIGLRKFFTLASLCALGLGLWAFWLEPASLYNEDHELTLPGWPKSCDRLRVAVLADLHVGSPFNGIDKLEQIVDLTLEAKPDLILLAGDYVIHGVVGGKFVEPETIAKGLQRLAAPLGVFAVLGNHDQRQGAGEIRAAMESHGIKVLDDDSIPLRLAECRIWLAGLSDLWTGARAYQAALAKIPQGEATIAFTHNPDAFAALPKPVTLTIAGHTHGGQVRLPLLGRLVVPSDYGERYAIGHVVENGRHLFVSPGLGTSIFPVRFLVPPEVSVLTLRSAKPN